MSSVNTSYTDYYNLLTSSQSSSSASSVTANWTYSGSKGASEASFRTKTKEALANEVSDSGKTFLVDAKSSSEDLTSAISSLISKMKDSSYNVKTASSSDEDLLSIKSVDSGSVKSQDNMAVDIKQLASTQVNGNTGLDADAKTEIASGNSSLRVTIGEKSYTINYAVKEGATNQEAQYAIADAINNANIGVTSSVSYDSTTGESTLQLESTATGTDAAFTVEDVAGNGAAKTGLNQTTQQASNAKYSVNGGDLQSSQSNTVDLGNGVTATLKGVTTGSKNVTVSMGTDTEDLTNSIKDVLDAYNSLLKSASANSSDSRTNGLYKQLINLTSTYASSLEKVGVSVSTDGSLSINDKSLSKASEVKNYYQTSDLEKFISSGSSSGSYGFLNRLNSLAGKVNNDPSNYVTVGSSSSSSSATKLSSAQVTTYNQYANASLLFETWS